MLNPRRQVARLAKEAKMQRAAAMDRDLSYLKALHRQYRAIDICLRHKVTRELMLVDLAS